jgi:plastocyanin
MEAVRSEAAEAPNRVYDRMALALFVPLGILAFALVTIYFLSRIYLSLPTAGASIMAILVAIGILVVAWYFAVNPAIPRWQLAGVVGLTTIALVGGGIAAAFYDEEHKEVLPSGGHEAVNGNGEQPPPPPNGGPPGAPEIPMEDNSFPNGNVTIAGGAEVVINVINNGNAVHNVHVALDGEYDGAPGSICRTTGDEPCTDPASIRGGESGTLTVNLTAGTYDFRCDFHPVEMQAQLIVE